MSVDHIRRGARIPHYLSPLSFAVAVAFSPTLLAADSSDELALPTMQVWGTQVSSSSEFLSDQDISVKQAAHRVAGALARAQASAMVVAVHRFVGADRQAQGIHDAGAAREADIGG